MFLCDPSQIMRLWQEWHGMMPLLCPLEWVIFFRPTTDGSLLSVKVEFVPCLFALKLLVPFVMNRRFVRRYRVLLIRLPYIFLFIYEYPVLWLLL